MSGARALGNRFDAIAIGASAGGAEALSELLAGLPARMRACVLVVLHLPRDRPSLLPSLLQGRCAVRVEEACDKQAIEPGCVYLAPSDYHLLVDDGPALALSFDPPVHYSRPSIDVLFESAAALYGERLLGIVLTGANHDGAAGLLAVVRAGGDAWVQDPATARVPAMPAAALRRVPAARALSLAAMSELLSTIAPGPSA